MFNKEEIFDLKERIKSLEKQVKDLNEPYLGECYLGVSYAFYYTPDLSNYKKWFKFKAENIQDRVNSKIKIFGVWLDKEDVIFYDGVFGNKKEKVEKKYLI